MYGCLNSFQEKALSIYMDKYGIDAGLEIMDIYENTNKTFGESMVFVTKKIQQANEPDAR